MSETKKLNEGAKFAHATIGNVADFSGKAFMKDVLGLTGAEVSFGTLGPGHAVTFFHAHKGNEEVYIFLSGEGTFQVDRDTFPIASGSVVRVSTGASRNHKNNSNEPMNYILSKPKKEVLTAAPQMMQSLLKQSRNSDNLIQL